MTIQTFTPKALSTLSKELEGDRLKLEWYLRLGLLGEYGEVCEKFKKLIRDKDTLRAEQITPEDRHAIALELGDMLWYLTVINHFSPHTVKSRDLSYYMPDNVVTTEMPFVRVVAINPDICSIISAAFFNNTSDKYVFKTMFFALLRSLGVVTNALGYNLNDLLQMNIRKLKSRKNRNKIAGSGDYR